MIQHQNNHETETTDTFKEYNQSHEKKLFDKMTTAVDQVSMLQRKLHTAEKYSMERICDIGNQGNKSWMDLQVQGCKERQSDVLDTLIALQRIKQSSEIRTQLLKEESEEKKTIIKHRIAELKSLANERKLATKKASTASIIPYNQQVNHKTVDSSFIANKRTKTEKTFTAIQIEEESTQDYKPFVLSRFRKSPSSQQMRENHNPCPKKSEIKEQKPEPLNNSPSEITSEGGIWNEWGYRVGIF